MSIRTLTLLPLITLLHAAPAPGQTAVVTEGDSVAGVGNVTSIANLAVNDAGVTHVEVDTDNVDTDADGALLQDGALLLREGQALGAPAGSTLDTFDGVSLNVLNRGFWNFFLDGTTGSDDDSGVYWGTDTTPPHLIVQEGDVSIAPEFGVGSTYRGFFETKITNGDGMLVMASVDDTDVAGDVNRALVWMFMNMMGDLQAEQVVVKEGDLLPGQTEVVDDLETGPHAFAHNAFGDVIFIADLAGDASVDHAVYLNDTLLAQEGSHSPVPGRPWSSLSSAEVGIDGEGGWVISGSLAGDSASNLLIERSGSKLVQEGDVLPGTQGFALTSFGSGPVLLGDNGNVLWYGDWADPDTDVDTGLFLNDQLLVQEGVTQVGGVTIDTLRGIQDGYAMSPDGEWVLFEAVLDNGDEVAALIEVGPWTYLGQSLAGSVGHPAAFGAGELTPGTPVSVSLGGTPPGATAYFILGLSALDAPFKGGTLVPALDLYTALPTDGNGELLAATTWPAGVPSGFSTYFQWWIVDPGGIFGFAASNAVAGTTP